MLTQPLDREENLAPVLDELGRLRRFVGAPTEFWPVLISVLARLVQASRGLLILRDPAQADQLRKLAEWSASGQADRAVLAFSRGLPQLAEQAIRLGRWQQVLDHSGVSGSPHVAVGVKLQFLGGQEQCVAALLLPNATGAEAREALVRLQLAADLPLAYQTNHAAQQARQDVEKFTAVLDVMVLVNAERRFRAAALAFCNGLADRFRCERVSLGWLESGYVRLKAISRTERFDKQMAAVQAVEVVMEEALDQDDEVIWPAPPGLNLITHDHARFAREQGVAHVVSVPLRLEGKAVGGLTGERQSGPFTLVEVQQLRLACDQAVRRLADLHRLDRWFGARWLGATKEQCTRLVGPEHTWAKVLSLLGVVALLALLLPVYPYRVEGNFILRSEEVAYLTAPFDGFIKSVQARPGDILPGGGVLLQLNSDQLELEEAAAIADLTRYLREAEKARATKALAEMRIAQALADQAKARLDLVRYRLGRARIKAPFDGVVIEGDLRQRIGAPVKQGEALFKLARTDKLYVEAEINERDVHEIVQKTAGEVAFVSQPRRKFPLRVIRLEPAAVPKEKENVFLLRGALTSPPEPWWRPGMSGVCKIDIGKRTLGWILTHRTVDFLRMLLWW